MSNENVRHIALDVVQRNGYFAHPESILITMLGNDNDVSPVLALYKNNTLIHLFHLPTLNLKADTHYELVDK